MLCNNQSAACKREAIGGFKLCLRCREQKRVTNRKRRSDPAYRAAERPKKLQWYYENREHCSRYARRRNLQVNYGITPEQWESLFESQGKKCATCGTPNPTRRGWALDHDHKTKKVRGILCGKCNSALGLLDDNKEKCLGILVYLEKHHPEH